MLSPAEAQTTLTKTVKIRVARLPFINMPTNNTGLDLKVVIMGKYTLNDSWSISSQIIHINPTDNPSGAFVEKELEFDIYHGYQKWRVVVCDPTSNIDYNAPDNNDYVGLIQDMWAVPFAQPWEATYLGGSALNSGGRIHVGFTKYMSSDSTTELLNYWSVVDEN
jgi:hypothetical protein